VTGAQNGQLESKSGNERSPLRHILIGMGLLAASTLLLQIALTRVFSVAQFYHFAFLVVSLALLGFGVSGTAMALLPRLRSQHQLSRYTIGFAASTLLGYLFVNHFAFDSYSIAWDLTQAYLLVANLLALTIPFVFAGLLIGSVLSYTTEHVGKVYAADLFGSAFGAIIAPQVLQWIGSERTILLCTSLSCLAGLLLATGERRLNRIVSAASTVISLGLFLLYPPLFEVNPSPYKTLSQFRLNPDAEILTTYQNAYSRLDLVASPTIHSALGLSLNYFGDLPPQHGLLIDGSNLQPVSEAARTDEELLRALPIAIAYAVKPAPNVLLLGSGGGMEVLAALAHESEGVTVIEPNELVYTVLTNDLRAWAGLADNPQVSLRHDEIRSFVSSTTQRYDVVELPLVESYRPISSGAFTLTEDYTLTVEAFEDYLSLLESDGLFVVSRWLQTPPSECLRTLALIVSALGSRNALDHIVAFRSFQHVTFIVKPTPFTSTETTWLLAAIEDLRYDLLLAPEMPETMINQYARLERDIYHETFLEYLQTENRNAFHANYVFEITPPRDERPFFFHFFRWEQTPGVIENLGRRWQPFGGSGYFVLLALLVFALIAALVFIVAPIALKRSFRRTLVTFGRRNAARTLGYFILIGLAFLLVEISLIQQYILLLGQPTLAVATVIGALLLFSGLGSALSPRVPPLYAMFALVALLVIYPWVVDTLSPLLLPLPLIARVLAVASLIAPLGLLMGMPFPTGIARLGQARELVPWAWAANGSASVVSAVLAATFSLSLGFTPVLMIGGGLYLLAAFIRSRG
jgi:spermidine synthase